MVDGYKVLTASSSVHAQSDALMKSSRSHLQLFVKSFISSSAIPIIGMLSLANSTIDRTLYQGNFVDAAITRFCGNSVARLGGHRSESSAQPCSTPSINPSHIRYVTKPSDSLSLRLERTNAYSAVPTPHQTVQYSLQPSTYPYSRRGIRPPHQLPLGYLLCSNDGSDV